MKYFITTLALMFSFNGISKETNQQYKERMRAADKKMAKNNHITPLVLNKTKKANENPMLEMVRSMDRAEKTNLSDENMLKIANIMDSMLGMKFKERLIQQEKIDLIKKGEEN